MKYVTIVVNKDGVCQAVSHEDFRAAKVWVRSYLTDPRHAHGPNAEELMRMERDFLSARGQCTESIQGSDTWKELVYITPFMEPAPVIKKTQKRII